MALFNVLPWDMVKRIKKLEAELAELKRNTVLQLNGVLSLDDSAECQTVRLSSANLQIVNGENRTDSANGCGNLIIGYNVSAQESTSILFVRP